MAHDTQTPPAVLVREVPATSGRRIGIATLEVEKALDSLTLDMIRALDAADDNKPQWTPPTPDRVTDAWVAEHFAAPWASWQGNGHPLAD